MQQRGQSENLGIFPKSLTIDIPPWTASIFVITQLKNKDQSHVFAIHKSK